MSTRTNNAYFVSVTLHALFVGLMFFVAYETTDTKPMTAKVMELVAGEGNNYAATEAPALGIPGGIKVAIPTPPSPPTPTPAAAPPDTVVPMQQADPAPPIPNTVTKAPPEKRTKPVPTKTAKTAAKPDPARDMAKDFKRIENKRAARLEAQYKKQQEAADRRARAAELARQAANARLDAEGIRAGVVGGSTANKDGGAGGKALTREDGELMAAYIALLESHVKDNHVQPDGLSDALTCKVAFYLGKDGSISSVRIVRSSGNSDFDRSVIEAFNKTSSIGPRPDHQGETLQVEFNLKENTE